MKEKRLRALVKKYGQASYCLTNKEVNNWNKFFNVIAINDSLENKSLTIRFVKKMPNILSICNTCGYHYSIIVGLKRAEKNIDINFVFLHELGHFFLFNYDYKFTNKTIKNLPACIIREYQADMIADFLSRKYNIKIQTKSKLFNLSNYGFFNLFIKEKNKSVYKKILKIKNETYKAIKQLFNNPDDVLKKLNKKLKNYKPEKDFYIN